MPPVVISSPKTMADEDENNNEKVKKFGAHSVAHESSEDLNSKELSENCEYSNAKGFTYVVSCAKKKCYVLLCTYIFLKKFHFLLCKC